MRLHPSYPPAVVSRHPRSFRQALLGLLLLGAAGCGGRVVQLKSASPSPGTVAPFSISGPAEARVGGSFQYAASPASTVSLTWKINGVAGGSADLGSISASGAYVPPPKLAGSTVTVSAQADQTVSSPLTVSVLNPLPVLASGSVSQKSPGTTYSVDLRGSGFLPGSQLQINGVAATVALLSGTELQSTISLPTGTHTLAVGVLNPASGQSSPVTLNLPVHPLLAATSTQAARILDQTTFGPTLTSIQHVQQVGIPAYLSEQFAAAPTLMPAIPAPPVPTCPDATYRCAQSSFWRSALTANDQLRQRVAFALSEIFVVSTNGVNARSIPSFQNTLVNDAFSNYRQIMYDVTLTPAMGAYLNLLDSAAPSAGQIANENFAREFLQLFTTGLYLLNPDGTPALDASGNPQPVYTEAQVQAYARAYTGWTYANSTGGLPTRLPNGLPNFDQPMQPFVSAHDISPKALLGGVTLPAGQTPQDDLSGAVDSVFHHPNVGPFVSRQLIQHLVTSDPSPAYVARVASIFANNGSGTRGDMQAIVTAILLDPEARAADADATVDGGHLREPILYLTGIIRGLEAVDVDPQGRYDKLSSYMTPLGQVPYASPSVFNFFPPDYVIPGTSLNAPEFAEENTAAVFLRLNLADTVVRNHLGAFSVDMSATSTFGQIASATGDPNTDTANLVETLNLVFLHDQMPDDVRTAITTYAALFTDTGQRDRIATWLVLSSNLYKISH